MVSTILAPKTLKLKVTVSAPYIKLLSRNWNNSPVSAPIVKKLSTVSAPIKKIYLIIEHREIENRD
jgi:hypothetical protein